MPKKSIMCEAINVNQVDDTSAITDVTNVEPVHKLLENKITLNHMYRIISMVIDSGIILKKNKKVTLWKFHKCGSIKDHNWCN